MNIIQSPSVEYMGKYLTHAWDLKNLKLIFYEGDAINLVVVDLEKETLYIQTGHEESVSIITSKVFESSLKELISKEIAKGVITKDSKQLIVNVKDLEIIFDLTFRLRTGHFTFLPPRKVKRILALDAETKEVYRFYDSTNLPLLAFAQHMSQRMYRPKSLAEAGCDLFIALLLERWGYKQEVFSSYTPSYLSPKKEKSELEESNVKRLLDMFHVVIENEGANNAVSQTVQE